MELSPQERQAISDHCLPMSWQMLSAWRLRHLGSLNDGPELMASWLAAAPQRSQALAGQMVRSLSQRLWRVDQMRAEDAAPKSGAGAGLRKLCVVCGGQRWILWLQPQPRLQLLRISQ